MLLGDLVEGGHIGNMLHLRNGCWPPQMLVCRVSKRCFNKMRSGLEADSYVSPFLALLLDVRLADLAKLKSQLHLCEPTLL